ncbi:MAG: hypothetical protein LBV45_01930 [Xanthomonadaceae bacterium]|nr:hypothetical protein [Xanthomonadaceae bacterium]
MTTMAYFIIVPFVMLGIFRYGGAFMLFLMPLVLVYIVVEAIRAAKRGDARAEHLLNIKRWIIAIAIVAFFQIWQYHEMSKRANQTVALINTYKTTDGNYPANLMAIGMNEKEAHGKWGFLYHVQNPEHPSFCWRDTFFREICFDFASSSWRPATFRNARDAQDSSSANPSS